MNMRPENRCPGSGTSAFNPWKDRRAPCPSCQRVGIRIRTDGRYYEHSRRGPTFNDLLGRELRRRELDR